MLRGEGDPGPLLLLIEKLHHRVDGHNFAPTGSFPFLSATSDKRFAFPCINQVRIYCDIAHIKLSKINYQDFGPIFLVINKSYPLKPQALGKLWQSLPALFLNKFYPFPKVFIKVTIISSLYRFLS